jgi:flagellin
MTVINSNSAAMLTANSINQNDRAMTSTMERLSTGKRINSAADDAAGLAIATKMTAQVRGLDQAGRNANNATSMVQLADGAAEQVSNILQRMREIVVQAADGSNSVSDVAVLNVEFKQAAEEIDRIVDVTEFNGKKLLNGDAGGVAGSGDSTVTYQIGANASQTLTVDFSDFNLAAGSATNTTEKFVDASINDAFVAAMDPSTDVTLTDNEGNSITLTQADVTAATAASGLATLINNASGTFNLTATGDNTDGLTLTSDSSGAGSQVATITYTGTGTPSLSETPGVSPTPMTADLSGFKTTGMQTSIVVDGVSASTFDNTLNALDKAIEGVATQRATFGATMNRLEYAVDNLASSSLATATARGRIEDANYATETTALARTQIIAQAGTAMLAQANQKSQSVLSLLQ